MCIYLHIFPYKNYYLLTSGMYFTLKVKHIKSPLIIFFGMIFKVCGVIHVHISVQVIVHLNEWGTYLVSRVPPPFLYFHISPISYIIIGYVVDLL